MAKNGSLSAKSILERNTLLLEKDELENLMERNQENHVISEIKDAILDRNLNDVNKVVAEITENVPKRSKENEQTIDD